MANPLAGLIGKIMKDKGPDMQAIKEVLDSDSITIEKLLTLSKPKTITMYHESGAPEVRYDVVDRIITTLPGVKLFVGCPLGEDLYLSSIESNTFDLVSASCPDLILRIHSDGVHITRSRVIPTGTVMQ